MERSRGIYKPIRVLFGTPIYETAVDTCWHLQGYKTQVWAVNVINKMRDVEFQAHMLLKFPKATPPTFQNPKLLNMAKTYTEMLKEKQQETQTSRLLTAEEEVIEVVPRVLQGFRQLPPKPLLNMASKSLSIVCASLTKATLDKVSKTVTAMESHAIFSSSIRDDVVQTILTEIREQIPLDILLNSISNFAPKLLSTIAVVAKKYICKLFEETPIQSLPMSESHPSEEPPAEPPSLSEGHSSEEPPAEPPSLTQAIVPVFIVKENSEELQPKKKKKKKMGFFSKFLRTLCCCVSPTATD